MISCKKASELISKSMEEQLSVREGVSLKVHLFVCEFCEQFKKQIETLRTALSSGMRGSKLEQFEETLEAPIIPTETKERIKKLIDDRAEN